MNKRLSHLYDMYNSHDVTFNQSVIKSLGLIADKVVMKCGDVKLPCIIYSASLVGARIIIKLTENHINYIRRKNGAVSLSFSFKVASEKNSISFYANSRTTHLSIYNENKPDYYYCLLEYTKRAPDDLIDILGTHIDKQQNMHKRAEERFVINTDMHKSLVKNSLENICFINGKGKRCILTELSIFSAKIILVGLKDELVVKNPAMLLIKYKELEGLGEMLGTIERVELVNQEESLYSVIISFNQDMIPPSYKMWIAEFIALVHV